MQAEVCSRVLNSVKDGASVRPNGLPFSRAAPIDRENIVADSDGQNCTDLVAAQRHRLQWRVSPQAGGVCSLQM